MVRRLLVANRGEIAVRVIRACHDLGITAVAIYSEADARALHVLAADEAVCIGPPPAVESYLSIPAIVAAAQRTGADAVHPGYGFLSENPEFAEACLAAGLVWVGPPPAAMRAMASKSAAKDLAASLGVPLLPGYQGEDQSLRRLRVEAQRTGYPLLIKASAGGGGRGMRAVASADEFDAALAGARREARAAFGDDRVLLERHVLRPRHIEVQVFGDRHGNVIALGERECSVQRRHQKVIEEAPSPVLTPSLRREMEHAAVTLSRAIRYEGAGTVEFLLDEGGRFAFLEMNTRLQVEHGVTEMVTGLDLVHLQLRVAAGEPLPLVQEEVRRDGHAIECRVYAEDPASGYLPSAGVLDRFRPPHGAGVRTDAGYYEGAAVTSYYDALLAKLMVHGPDRDAAAAGMAAALDAFEIGGVVTNLALLRGAVRHPAFMAGQTFTTFLEEHVLPALAAGAPPIEALLGAAAHDLLGGVDVPAGAGPWAAGPWRQAGVPVSLGYIIDGAGYRVEAVRLVGGRCRITVEGATRTFRLEAPAPDRALLRVEDGAEVFGFRFRPEDGAVRLDVRGRSYLIRRAPPPTVAAAAAGGARGGAQRLTAPLAGVVVQVMVHAGERVRARQPLLTIEAMKMEHVIVAQADAAVARVACGEGDRVQAGDVLVELE